PGRAIRPATPIMITRLIIAAPVAIIFTPIIVSAVPSIMITVVIGMAVVPIARLCIGGQRSHRADADERGQSQLLHRKHHTDLPSCPPSPKLGSARWRSGERAHRTMLLTDAKRRFVARPQNRAGRLSLLPSKQPLDILHSEFHPGWSAMVALP